MPSPAEESARKVAQELINRPCPHLNMPNEESPLGMNECTQCLESALLTATQEATEKERAKWKNLRSGCCFAGVGQACPIHEKG